MGVKTSLVHACVNGPAVAFDKRVHAGVNTLAVCIAAANVNDHRLLTTTLYAIVVERPERGEAEPQHLCLDKGYDNAPSRQVLEERGYVEHIRPIGLEKVDEEAGEKKHPARRWVVERTLSWLCRWRGIQIRWEKKPNNYLASIKLACALLWFRRAWREGSIHWR